MALSNISSSCKKSFKAKELGMLKRGPTPGEGQLEGGTLLGTLGTSGTDSPSGGLCLEG